MTTVNLTFKFVGKLMSEQGIARSTPSTIRSECPESTGARIQMEQTTHTRIHEVSENFERYQYMALHHEDSIRLLKLRSGTINSPLRCDIVEVRMSTNPPFEALSYTWGEPVFPRIIQDTETNTAIHISENLFDALIGLRDQVGERTLWIDQVCIDQTNSSEKSHQVARMGDIYRNACKTLVWLGKENAVELMDVLETIGQDFEAFGYSKIFPFPQSIPTPEALARYEEFVKSCRAFNMYAMFARPWFERIWVVQEFILAKDLGIYCGDRCITYDHFSKALCILSLFPKRPALRQLLVQHNPELMSNLFDESTTSSKWFRGWELVQQRERYMAARRMAHATIIPDDEKVHHDSMIQTFIFAKDLKCSIPHDRVYGMLGIANEDLCIIPDYSMEPEALWRQLALRTLESGDLTVLHYAGLLPDRTTSASFVTDFSRPNYQAFRLGGHGTPRFHAGGADSNPRVRLITMATEKKTTVKYPIIKGASVDKIANHLFIRSEDDQSSAPVDENALLNIFLMIKDLIGAGHDAYPDEGFASAFARTIVINNAHRITHGAFGLSAQQNSANIIIYLAIVLSTVTIGGRKFTMDQAVASMVGPVTLALNMFEGDEQALYEFPAPPGASVQVRLEEGGELMSLVEFQGPLVEALQSYLAAVSLVLADRSLFVTERGYIGLGPRNIQQGDLVFIPVGGETPFVVHAPGVEFDAAEKVPVCQLVGECYLHGWMGGEQFGKVAEGELVELLLV